MAPFRFDAIPDTWFLDLFPNHLEPADLGALRSTCKSVLQKCSKTIYHDWCDFVIDQSSFEEAIKSACRQGLAKILKRILQHPAANNKKQVSDLIVGELHAAVKTNNRKILNKEFLEMVAAIIPEDKYVQRGLLRLSMYCTNLACIKFLVEKFKIPPSLVKMSVLRDDAVWCAEWCYSMIQFDLIDLIKANSVRLAKWLIDVHKQSANELVVCLGMSVGAFDISAEMLQFMMTLPVFRKSERFIGFVVDRALTIKRSDGEWHSNYVNAVCKLLPLPHLDTFLAQVSCIDEQMVEGLLSNPCFACTPRQDKLLLHVTNVNRLSASSLAALLELDATYDPSDLSTVLQKGVLSLFDETHLKALTSRGARLREDFWVFHSTVYRVRSLVDMGASPRFFNDYSGLIIAKKPWDIAFLIDHGAPITDVVLNYIADTLDNDHVFDVRCAVVRRGLPQTLHDRAWWLAAQKISMLEWLLDEVCMTPTNETLVHMLELNPNVDVVRTLCHRHKKDIPDWKDILEKHLRQDARTKKECSVYEALGCVVSFSVLEGACKRGVLSVIRWCVDSKKMDVTADNFAPFRALMRRKRVSALCFNALLAGVDVVGVYGSRQSFIVSLKSRIGDVVNDNWWSRV